MRVDRIFESGRLLTMDAARARAAALAVLGGRIVAVGDGDELRYRQRSFLDAALILPGSSDDGRVAHDRTGLGA